MKEILAKEVQQALEQGKRIHLIDVREVDEIKAGHIPGIIHIPLGLLEFRMHELNKSESYVVICRSGGRSGQAALFLEGHGFNVANMVGGMLAWNGDLE